MWCIRGHQLLGSCMRTTGATRLLPHSFCQGQRFGKTLPFTLGPGSCLPPCSCTPRTPIRCHSTDRESFRLVYTAPLKGAIRAVKVFSLCTAVSAAAGGPVLVILGNPGVPLAGRVAISSLVVMVGLSTTAILHWLTKGYVIKMLYNQHTETVAAYTLSLLARLKRNEFHLSESGPPPSTAGFSSFQARGKSYFMHLDVFENRQLLGNITGAFVGTSSSTEH